VITAGVVAIETIEIFAAAKTKTATEKSPLAKPQQEAKLGTCNNRK
jgi:hypothetical protein